MCNNIQHKQDCKRVFNRYDMSCARCVQLSSGAPARKGWGNKKAQDEARRIADIKAHDCVKSKCGPVCTFGDW